MSFLRFFCSVLFSCKKTRHVCNHNYLGISNLLLKREPFRAPINWFLLAMGHKLWLHFGVDEHRFATYFDVHQGYRVLTHSLWCPASRPSGENRQGSVWACWATRFEALRPYICCGQASNSWGEPHRWLGKTAHLAQGWRKPPEAPRRREVQLDIRFLAVS